MTEGRADVGDVPTAHTLGTLARMQLWVNLVLAHAEATRRGADEAAFAVCASSRNTALLEEGKVLGGFRSLLRRSESVDFIDLEALLRVICEEVPSDVQAWADGLRARYGDI